MRRNKAVIILVVIAAVFSVIAFAVPFPKGGVFWTAYIAEIVALALQIPIFKMAFDGADTPKSKFLGFPVFRVGYIYLSVQTVLSLALFALGFTPMPTWVAVVLCVIVLGAALVSSIAAKIARKQVTLTEQKQTSATAYMTSLRTRSAQLVNKAGDTKLKTALERLAENIQYSDPVSSPATADSEAALDAAFKQLETAVSTNNTNAEELCRRVQIALDDRNAACKAGK